MFSNARKICTLGNFLGFYNKIWRNWVHHFTADALWRRFCSSLLQALFHWWRVHVMIRATFGETSASLAMNSHLSSLICISSWHLVIIRTSLQNYITILHNLPIITIFPVLKSPQGRLGTCQPGFWHCILSLGTAYKYDKLPKIKQSVFSPHYFLDWL